jgi:hypothetical protein
MTVRPAPTPSAPAFLPRHIAVCPPQDNGGDTIHRPRTRRQSYDRAGVIGSTAHISCP